MKVSLYRLAMAVCPPATGPSIWPVSGRRPCRLPALSDINHLCSAVARRLPNLVQPLLFGSRLYLLPSTLLNVIRPLCRLLPFICHLLASRFYPVGRLFRPSPSLDSFFFVLLLIYCCFLHNEIIF